MFVYNNFQHDTRVLKEARTLAAVGYEVTIVALLDNPNLLKREQEGSITVIRVDKNPLHFRLLKKKTINPRNTTKLPSAGLIIENKHSPIASSGSQESVALEEKQRVKSIAVSPSATQKNSLNDQEIVGSATTISCQGVFIENNRNDSSKFRHGGAFKTLKKVFKRALKKLRSTLKALKKTIKMFRGVLKVVITRVRLYFKKILKFIRRTFSKTISRFKRQFLSLMPIRLHKFLCLLDFHLRSLKLPEVRDADIYHAHDLNVLGVACHAAFRHGGKVVYDSHEFYLERNRPTPLNRLCKYLLRQYENWLIHLADAVITVSDSIALELGRRYQISRPIVILNAPSHVKAISSESKEYSGNKYSLREALDIPPTGKILLYSGGITFNRGLEKVIESLQYLTDIHLVLMGYGKAKYLDELKALAQYLRVQDRFLIFDAVPSNEVTTYAASADVGIAAIENVCLSYYFCSPNKLFEYINAGIPVSASNFPEMRKVVEKYDIGTLFDPNDAKCIAEAVKTIFADPDRYRTMSQNTQMAALEYNWEQEAQKLIALYSAL